MTGGKPLERRLQLSGTILILALLVEALSLLGHGPIAFIIFVGVGGVLFAAGILFYLYSLVSGTARPPNQ